MKARPWSLLLFTLATSSLATFFYPNAQHSILEHHLIDTSGAHASPFASARQPCRNYVSGAQTLGRETAAQWLRVAFHDFVTADAEKGIGGIDASVGFEKLREVNSGSAFDDSFGWFRAFYERPGLQYVSTSVMITSLGYGFNASVLALSALSVYHFGNLFPSTLIEPFLYDRVIPTLLDTLIPSTKLTPAVADLIALSVTLSLSNCGGPIVPLRPGRIDALGPGVPGVPAPETPLLETLEMFAKAGFNQPDSIALTACGHTMGSVHHGGFPFVVGPEAVSENNTAGGIHFDGSVDVFDTKVPGEFLEDRGEVWRTIGRLFQYLQPQ